MPAAAESIDYKRIFNGAPALLLVLAADEAFTILDATDAYLQATYTERDDILGRPLFEVFPAAPDQSGARNLRASLEKVRATGRADTMPVQWYSIRRPAAEGGGFEERFWAPVNSPVLADDGQLHGIIHRVEDVTPLLRAPDASHADASHADSDFVRLQALLKSGSREFEDADRLRAAREVQHLAAQLERDRRFYHAILSSTPDLVYVFGLDHRFTFANEALLRMWGRTWDNAIGKNCLELGYAPWHAVMHDREIEQVVATGKPIRGEVPFTGTNGRRIYDYIFVPVFGADGHVEAVAGTTRDITEMVQARETVAEHGAELERLVNERTARLQQTVAQMEEFSYSVSHDLRSPVRAMRGFSEALLEDHAARLDPDGRELLQRIHRSSVRMERLIQDLLTYSRISRRDFPLEAVSLGRLLHEVIQQYPELRADQARIDAPEVLPAVLAHEPSLTQVISNLLSNAVKFVAPGTRPHVRIGFERDGERVRVSFQDNGIGIAPEQMARLFGLFERLHADRRYEGTGIGLAIVRKAIERMNGRVGVESQPSAGSRFWFELTAAPETRDERHEVSGQKSEGARD